MGYQTTGQLASIASTGASGAYIVALLNATNGMAARELDVTGEGDAFDNTVFGSGLVSAANLQGLNTWGVVIRGRYPGTGRKTGATGLLSYSSGGYALHVRQYELVMEATVHDITQMATAGVTWKAFRPGLTRWSGTYEAMCDSATALVLPPGPSGAALAATFKVIEVGATDQTFAGNLHCRQVGASYQVDGLNAANYAFNGDGDLTLASPSTNTGLLPDGVINFVGASNAHWNAAEDGVPDRTVLMTQSPSRTLTGTGFLSKLVIRVKVDQPIEVEATITGAGVLTPA